MKLIIVGGVAAGASAAARARRLNEQAEIILFEKGDFISYANCGLPYHLGGVIPDRDRLLITSPEKFKAWFNVDLRVKSEVLSIDRAAKTVTVRSGGRTYSESYDKLLLATGSTPVEMALPGMDDARIGHLWTLADMDKMQSVLNRNARRVLIVGAGFIGLETAENLAERGLDVTLVQRGSHVLPSFDGEMTLPLVQELAARGVRLLCNRTVAEFRSEPDAVSAVLDDGTVLSADAVIVAAGVRPASELAQKSGLSCTERGHIRVNEHMQTDDDAVYAAGDAVAVTDPVFGELTAVPLAGPANKQGRIAADNIFGIPSCYRGSIGTSVVKLGNLTAASVGWTEARLKSAGKSYRKLYLHPASAASYYPGGARLDLKLLFGDDKTVFGAQIIGSKGVDKRIDAIASVMRENGNIESLAALELAYAPPYSSAKDPVNFAGFVAQNILSGRSDAVYAEAIPPDAVILDVREKSEFDLGAIPGARNLPLGELRAHLDELDSGKPIVAYCQVGLRGYLAERILKQHGFTAFNLSGGYLTWKMVHPDPVSVVEKRLASVTTSSPVQILDVRNLPCPGPVVKLKMQADATPSGGTFRVLADLPFEGDLLRWAQSAGFAIAGLSRSENGLEADVVKTGSAPVSGCACSAAGGDGSAAIIVFSNDFDKVMAAMILANGLAASGAKVGMFFTFWGLSVLRKNPAVSVRKNWLSRMFGWMLPKGASQLVLSKMNMFGMGTAMMKHVMAEQRVLTLPELIQSARSAGVKFIACDMAMNVMGITREELIEVDEIAGVAAFAELAKNSSTTLFI